MTLTLQDHLGVNGNGQADANAANQNHRKLEAILRTVPVDVMAEYGVSGNSDDNITSVVQSAAAEASENGRALRFGEGSFYFENVAIPAHVPIIGAGYDTQLVSKGQPLFSVTGTSGQDWTYMADFRISHTVDMDYDDPLIKLTTCRNTTVERIESSATGDGKTGTIFALDRSYITTFSQMALRTGRYAVPLEFYYSVQEQIDTLLLEQFLVVGSAPVILRGALPGVTVSEMHGCHLLGYKHVCTSESASDRKQPLSESTTTATRSAGDTTLTVQAGDGALFAVDDPIYIDTSRNLEVAKVTGIATDTLTFTPALRFSHAASVQVLAHSMAVSHAGANLLTLDACHFEGENVGLMVSTGGLIEVSGTYMECQELCRATGAVTNLILGRTRMHGDTTNTRNIVLKIPTANANGPTAVILRGPFEQASGSDPVTPVEGTLTGKVYDWYDTQTSATVPRQVRNFTAGQEANTMRQALKDGTSAWREFHDGRKRWENVTEPQIIAEAVLSGSGVSVQILMGNGTPEANVAARVGSLFLRKDGGAGTSLYVKETGTGNTGWAGK